MSTNLTTTFAPLTTIISWFGENAVPTDKQFETTWKSFFHKSENIPLEQIYQLSEILNLKAERVHSHLDMAKRDGSNLTNSDITGLKEVLGVALAANGIIGNVETAISTEVANGLTDGIYKPKTTGVYSAIGLTAKENYSTLFRKNAGVWSVFSEEKIPIQDLTPLEIQQKALSGADVIPFIPKSVGKYIDSLQGYEGDVVGYSSTDFIDISNYDILNINPSAYQQFAFYNEDKVFISGRTFCTDYFRKPINAKYVRFSIKDGDNFYFHLSKDNSIEMPRNKLDSKFTTSGFYVNATSGWKEVLGIYSYSDFIPVKAGDIVRYKIHDQYAGSAKHLSFFDANFKFKKGNTTTFQETADADGYVIISMETNLLYSAVLTINNINLQLTSESNIVIKRENVLGLSDPYSVFVSKNGGDFPTLNEAVEYGKNIGTPDRKFNINFEGVFQEHLNIAPYHINLYGKSKETSIIIDDSGDYYKVPVNASGKNSGANFTALATNSQGATPAIRAYGMHCDHDGEGKSVWFNCRFSSDVNAGVGLGTQHQQQFFFIQCEIENNSSNYDGGGLYLHNSPYAGHKNMSVFVKDCVISSQLTALIIQDANANAGRNDDDGTVITFINNMFWSEISGKSVVAVNFNNFGSTAGKDVGQIIISPQSYGNNIQILNK